MPQHYVYADPNLDGLNQGDVLDRTDKLTEVLSNYHPHYAHHEDYKYFMVLTQSCDLVRRGGSSPKTHYITLAAVRPVEDALRREAAKHQEDWQRDTSSISGKTKDRLMSFMERLLDNNEPGYFYLHEDQNLRLAGNNCAFLALSVALRVEHYERCLGAKVAQLKEPFQAKLGWLVGNMYSRVGTTEWDDEITDMSQKRSRVANELIDSTLVTLDNQKINEGLKQLSAQSALEKMEPTEILKYIKSIKLVPRSTQFVDRAQKVLLDFNLSDRIASRVIEAIRCDTELQSRVEDLLTDSELPHSPELSRQLTVLLTESAKRMLKRDVMPGCDERLCNQVVALIAKDTRISSILKGS